MCVWLAGWLARCDPARLLSLSASNPRRIISPSPTYASALLFLSRIAGKSRWWAAHENLGEPMKNSQPRQMDSVHNMARDGPIVLYIYGLLHRVHWAHICTSAHNDYIACVCMCVGGWVSACGGTAIYIYLPFIYLSESASKEHHFDLYRNPKSARVLFHLA